MVESYGTRMPLIRVGTVSVLSPQMLSITPFDQSVSIAGLRTAPEFRTSLACSSIAAPKQQIRLTKIGHIMVAPTFSIETRRGFQTFTDGQANDLCSIHDFGSEQFF